MRPVFLRLDERVGAHVFLASSATALWSRARTWPGRQVPGLTPRTVIETFAAVQMVDVYLPRSDGRGLVVPRHTQPDADQRLLPHQLGLRLPEQPPPPRVRAQ